MSTTAEVRLWGSRIGAVTLADGERTAQFAYDPAFARSGIEVAPLTMPLAADPVYGFPSSTRPASMVCPACSPTPCRTSTAIP